MLGRAAIALSLLLWIAPRACGTVRVVDKENGPYFRIQAAIDASAAGDTVEVAPGFYTEALQAPVSLTLLSRDGPEVTILDGRDRDRLLEFQRADLVVDGFTFQHGRASLGGAAILYTIGSLQARRCRFRDNRAYKWDGGAVRAYGWVRGAFTECLFVGNEVEWLGSGGAVSIPESFDGAAARGTDEAAGAAGTESEPWIRFVRCSFLSNRSAEFPAIFSERVIDVQNCLFVDKLGAQGPFVDAPVGSTFACNLYHTAASPEVEGAKASGEDEEADPRLCPDDREAVHETSPIWNDPQGCGPIGNLPVGCTGPIALAVRPLALEAVPDQVIQVYGYGLEEVLQARLEGPVEVPARDLSLEGPWLTATFDLAGQSEGSWSLVLLTASGRELRREGLVLGGPRIWGFLDGWVAGPTVYTGKICGKRIGEDVTVHLQQEGQGALLPVEVIGRATDDTLLVRIDLRGAREGAYDLLVEFGPTEGRYAVRPALYLGAPPVIRVPHDERTIGAALESAPPCAEIRVAAGTYRESLTIRKPVRLRGEGASMTALRPATLGERGILVLPEAGSLTQIEGFAIDRCAIESSGAGISCLAPALIRDNSITDNRTMGPGSGAGVHAASGARIVRNRFHDNRANGTAGALYCRDCWVEENEFENNQAPWAGAIDARGVLRRNRVRSGGAWEFSYSLGVLQGEISGNRFDNCCGSPWPLLLVEGPSRLVRNVWTDRGRDLCYGYENVHLRGSMELIENIFANVGIQACLATDAADEPGPGHFVMERNFLSDESSYWVGFDFHLFQSEFCQSGGIWIPESPILPDSIRFSCNIKERWIDVRLGGSDCDTCAYELDDLPAGCPDTLPDFEYACDWVPVLLQSYGLEATADGVRLHWTVPIDQGADGFDVEREHLGWRERVNADRLPPCHECEYIDADPPYGEPTSYYLLIYADGGEPQEVLLGVWDGQRAGSADRAPRLLLPAPHPVRSIANLRFELPVEVASLRLDVLDLQGRRVARIREGSFQAGAHVVPWDARDAEGRPLASGVYVLRLSDGRDAWSRKFLLLR